MKTLFTSGLIMLATAALAQTEVEVQSMRGYPGQTATVPVVVRRATNIVAAQFDLGHAPARGTLQDAQLLARYSNHVVRSREVAPGVRRVLVYSRSNALLNTNGFSGRFDFEVPSSERTGSGPLTPQHVVLARADGSALVPVTAKSGTVFVTPLSRDPASGVVSLFLPSRTDERYLIQATTNFMAWEIISTNTASGDFLDLVDEDATRFPHRFYRSALYDGVFGPALRLAGPDPSGGFGFEWNGSGLLAYAVETSTNLATWVPVASLVPTNGILRFTDSNSTAFPQRFYRARVTP